MKEMDGLNSNKGPALIAMNCCPKTVNETTSQSPEGVLCKVVMFVMLESGKTEL